MRESKEENDLFFVCSLIEYIARATHNHKKVIVKALGIESIRKMYYLADVLHCENIEKIIDEYVEKYNITNGTFDPNKNCIYRIPDPFEIGRVYQRLILDVSKEKKQDYIETLIAIFNSFIIDKIDNFNSDMYYLNPEYIKLCYLEGKMLEY